MSDYFEIGKIVNHQGIKGDVRVVPMTDDIKRFELLKTIEVVFRKESKNLEIEKVWYNKQFVILKFKGIDDMDSALLLKDGVIRIPSKLGIPLSQDEYYLRDLYDVQVKTEEGEVLGKIANIILTGANDVYEVKNDEQGTSILIPAIKQCILNVDIKEKLMIVKLLDGLREINTKLYQHTPTYK